MTEKHPLEKFPGMTKTLTLPLSGVEVVIRKVDMEVLTQDMALASMKSSDLMQVAARYSNEVSEETSGTSVSERLMQEIDTGELMKNIRSGLLREAVIRPTIDQLRAEVYGGRADSSDLGMGPDYSYLVKAVDEFNAKPKDEDGEAKAAAFPETVGG